MTAQSAEAVVRRFFEVWNSGDVAQFDELVHPDFEDVWAPSPGYERGPSGARASYTATMTRCSEIHFDLEDVIAQDDAVACRTTFRFAARDSGDAGRMIGMNMFHLTSGKISREWYVYTKAS